jgi:cytochrome c-type biogenesis protein CcmH
VWILATLVAPLLLVAAATARQDLEREMREIAAGLRCPVCQNLSVADSPSEMAQEMRGLILDQLSAGKSREEIRAYFVSKYGEWILLSPTPKGFALLVWVLPGLGLLAALAGAVTALRRWSRRESTASLPVDESAIARVRAAVQNDDLSTMTAEEARLVEGLRELEFDYRAGKLSAHDYEELRTLYETRAAAALVAARQRKEQSRASEKPSVPVAGNKRAPAPRVWRLAAAAIFLLAFGAAIGFFLPQSVRPRGAESITGDFLTGTQGEVRSQDMPALLEQGQQAMEARDYKRALDLFTRALKANPNQPIAHANLGLILHMAGHPDKSLQSFDRALAIEPALPQALWGKGLVLYESMGKTGEAIRLWEMLLAQEISKEDREHVVSVLAQARKRLTAKRPQGQSLTR